ncbi:hypothetical protein LUZ60_012933 [Juncus effusus]|nr:hypothetical protein LUZ60_012933 [Juncus effusus]
MHIPCKDIFHKSKIHIFPFSIHKKLRCFGFCGSLYAIVAFTFFFIYFIFFFSEKTSFWKQCKYGNFTQSNLIKPQDRIIPTNLSHIVFGLIGSAKTWDMWRPYNELWWRREEMKGYLWLEKKPTASNCSWPDTCTPFKISKPTAKSVARKARIITDTYKSILSDPNLKNQNIRWFVFGDEDTVFFPENLIAVLRKYDHEQMYYIGSISESVEQVMEFSYKMAFGGAGFAISFPAAVELERIMEGCIKRYFKLYASDHLVQSCLSELGVPLTREPGFHQVDFRGSIYGMLAAHPITPLVSLHNFNHIKPISPHFKTQFESVKSLVDISKLDSARTLQQSICYDRGPGAPWSVSVSWGFTVEIYPWFVLPKDLVKALITFRSWRIQGPGPFTFDTRPRSNWPCDWPLTFSFRNAKFETGINGINLTVTEYLMDLNPTDQKCESPFFAEASKVKMVRVIAPKMHLNEWKLAPRRQCCETERINDGEMLIVRINECQPGQSSLGL